MTKELICAYRRRIEDEQGLVYCKKCGVVYDADYCCAENCEDYKAACCKNCKKLIYVPNTDYVFCEDIKQAFRKEGAEQQVSLLCGFEIREDKE